MQTALFYYEFLKSPEGTQLIPSNQARALTNSLHRTTESYSKKIHPLWEGAHPTGRQLTQLTLQRQIKAAHRFASRIALIEECLSATVYMALKKEENPKENALFEKFIQAILSKDWPRAEKKKRKITALVPYQAWLKETASQTFKSHDKDGEDIRPLPIDRTLGRVKNWSKEILELTPYGEESYNTVYPLYKFRSYRGVNFRSEHPVAFLKGEALPPPCTDEKEEAAAKVYPLTAEMEALVYDVAFRLGLSSSFAPTKLTQIETKAAVFAGSFQRRIRGIQLSQLFSSGKIELLSKEIPYAAFLNGFFISYLFGDTDGRLNNLFFDQVHKELIRFDNSRCLPHANGCIKKWGTLFLSFRCHLLQLPQALEAIHGQTKANFLRKLGKLEPFLENLEEMIQEKAVEKKWPIEWVDAKKMVNALKERAEKLRSLFSSSASVFDFVLEKEPLWAFASALRLLITLYENCPKHDVILPPEEGASFSDVELYMQSACVGEESIQLIFKKASDAGIDPDRVLSLCQNNKNAFAWIRSLCQYHNEKARNSGSVDRPSLADRYQELYGEFEKKGELDEKDNQEFALKKSQ